MPKVRFSFEITASKPDKMIFALLPTMFLSYQILQREREIKTGLIVLVFVFGITITVKK